MNRDATLQREAVLAFAVLQTVGSLVVVLDRSGSVTRFNRACERVTGYFFSEVWRRPFVELFIPPGDAADLTASFDRAWAGEPRVQGKGRWRTKRGDLRMVDWTCATAGEVGQPAEFLVVTGTDVTERVQAEEELAASRESLKKHSRELEVRVAERTRELSDINAELEAFSYSVSHDLRAPLRSMQGFALALKDDYGPALDETGRDYAERIIGSAQRMEELIEDLLAYGRLGRSQISLVAVELEPLVTDVVQQMLPLIAERRATVKVNGRLPRVLGHSATLFSVLENLLTNALKFVEPSVCPNVTLSADRHDGRVRLWVEDNGIGIDPTHHERIFKVFERLHGGDRFSGTGIGLAIVRRAVERLGGTHGLESTPGQGSRFWIELADGDDHDH
jgi:PAS domain S-box-containing protein